MLNFPYQPFSWAWRPKTNSNHPGVPVVLRHLGWSNENRPSLENQACCYICCMHLLVHVRKQRNSGTIRLMENNVTVFTSRLSALFCLWFYLLQLLNMKLLNVSEVDTTDLNIWVWSHIWSHNESKAEHEHRSIIQRDGATCQIYCTVSSVPMGPRSDRVLTVWTGLRTWTLIYSSLICATSYVALNQIQMHRYTTTVDLK